MASELPAVLGDLARCQDGVVSRPQALRSGLSVDQVKFRVTSGRWQPLYPGVYATFTGPPRRGARLWAALLRAGPGAALSYLTAAELHGLADQRSDQIHVTVPHERRVVAAPGLTVHRCRRAGLEIDPAARPPRTSVEETVLDLAHQAGTLGEACGWATRALVRDLTDAATLRAAMTARRTLRWRTDLELLLSAAARTARPHPNTRLRHPPARTQRPPLTPQPAQAPICALRPKARRPPCPGRSQPKRPSAPSAPKPDARPVQAAANPINHPGRCPIAPPLSLLPRLHHSEQTSQLSRSIRPKRSIRAIRVAPILRRGQILPVKPELWGRPAR